MSSCPTTSLVALCATQAAAAAAFMLQRVEETRRKEREKTVVRAMQQERKRDRWFHPRSRPITREEAESMVDARWRDCWGGTNPYGWWRIRGHGTEALAERIAKAARLSADGKVWLNLDDASEVADYIPGPAATEGAAT